MSHLPMSVADLFDGLPAKCAFARQMPQPGGASELRWPRRFSKFADFGEDEQRGVGHLESRFENGIRGKEQGLDWQLEHEIAWVS